MRLLDVEVVLAAVLDGHGERNVGVQEGRRELGGAKRLLGGPRLPRHRVGELRHRPRRGGGGGGAGGGGAAGHVLVDNIFRFRPGDIYCWSG